jgi:hypothetical protein
MRLDSETEGEALTTTTGCVAGMTSLTRVW